MLHQRVYLERTGYRSLIKRLSVIMCVTLVIGCGGDPNLGEVSGTIKLDGKPLENAFVTFTPTADSGIGGTSYGKTASDGTYQMIVSDSTNGVYLGESLVRVKTGDVKADGSGVIEETVPAIYNTKSELRREVKSGSNTFDFELKSTK